MSDHNPLINYSRYESNFNDNCMRIKHQPSSSRTCNDLPCTIILIIIMIGFIGIGVYEITGYDFSAS